MKSKKILRYAQNDNKVQNDGERGYSLFRNEQDKAREENPEELSYRRLKALLRRKYLMVAAAQQSIAKFKSQALFFCGQR